MNNVIRFDPRRKKEEPPKAAKAPFWTLERLAWPGFLIVVGLVYLVTRSGLMP